jgi:transcriptional regulator with XRE-family HTH domain
MNKNQEMICADCGVTFQSSSEVKSPIKHCPKCVKKIQEKMLEIIFGDPDVGDEKPKTRSKKSKSKIFPSLLNKEPLLVAKFKTIQERNIYVVIKRSEGYTLQAIASSLGLTREMIRQIVNSNSGPSASSVRNIRNMNKAKEVKNLAKNLTNPDLNALANSLNVSPGKVRKLMGSKAKNFPRGRRNFEQEYSDTDLISILKKYSKLAKGPLSVSRFTDLGGAPTAAVFYKRFGSWLKACELAGIEGGKSGRKNYKRAHTDEVMIEYVKSYLADPRTNGSAEGYDQWQRKVDGAPSLALIRQRVGHWNELKVLILKDF